MKKVLLINGSPRPMNNSQKMLNIFAEAAKKFGIETEIINLEKMNLGMCKGCLACFKTNKCFQKDGLNELVAKMEEADGIVVASPVYYGSVTAQMKTFMDRSGLLGEAHGRSFRSKLAGSITVARRWGHLGAQTDMMLWMDRTEMVHIGCGWCSATSTNDNDISSDEEGLQYPVRLAENFARIWNLEEMK